MNKPLRLGLYGKGDFATPYAIHRCFKNRAVRIWSGEHRAWWRDNYCGYTDKIKHAGLYTFQDAYNHTIHCGPEKKIFFELAGGFDD